MVLFEEQQDQIRLNFASFELEVLRNRRRRHPDDRCAASARRGSHSGVFDFSGLLALLTALIAETGARNIAFDGIDILLSVLNDETLERQEIARLREWVRDSGVTALLTVKDSRHDLRANCTAPTFLQYMTDCVVVFKNGFVGASTFLPDPEDREISWLGIRGQPDAVRHWSRSGMEVVGYSEKRLSHPTYSRSAYRAAFPASMIGLTAVISEAVAY